LTLIHPTAVTAAYCYNPDYGYKSQDTLKPGIGFWLKFDSTYTLTLNGGIPITGDTIDVAKGWNMIGAISTRTQVTSIASIPPGIITGKFFGYKDGYTAETALIPGWGYWIKASQSGKVILIPNFSEAKLTKDRIIIAQSEEFPPPPPPGEVSPSGGRPVQFALEQNYPNPFNPATTLRYQLPTESEVKLVIYNVLGQVVSTVVDETQSLGYKSVDWNAKGVAS
jgi:hypothetical protein